MGSHIVRHDHQQNLFYQAVYKSKILESIFNLILKIILNESFSILCSNTKSTDNSDFWGGINKLINSASQFLSRNGTKYKLFCRVVLSIKYVIVILLEECHKHTHYFMIDFLVSELL